MRISPCDASSVFSSESKPRKRERLRADLASSTHDRTAPPPHTRTQRKIATMQHPVYTRVVLKLSGEVLAGDRPYGTDPEVVGRIASELAEIHRMGVSLAVVVGGGNIFRGVSASARGMDRTTADSIGMLATLLNCLVLQNSLERSGVETRVLSAVEVRQLAEPYTTRAAVHCLEKKRLLLLAGGTGNPYFTTDTAAALRACEIHAEVLLKGTKVDGVYSEDPVKNPRSTLYREVTYRDVLDKSLRVMDLTAISLCMDNHIPIIVFNIQKPGTAARVVQGEPLGTIVRE